MTRGLNDSPTFIQALADSVMAAMGELEVEFSIKKTFKSDLERKIRKGKRRCIRWSPISTSIEN